MLRTYSAEVWQKLLCNETQFVYSQRQLRGWLGWQIKYIQDIYNFIKIFQCICMFKCIVGVRVAQSKSKKNIKNLRSWHPRYLWTKQENKFFLKITQNGGWKLYCFETRIDAQSCKENCNSWVCYISPVLILSSFP